MKAIFRIFLFFIFFVSFCIINVPSLDWGLQVSWAIALLIFIIYPFYTKGKFRVCANFNFKIISIFFFVLFISTILSWILQYSGIIKFDDIDKNELISRSLPHLVYVIFEYLIYLYLVVYLQSRNDHLKEIKCMIVYPFLFITLWGIYQWLTTFDVLSYFEIFNNSLSTKFTYLRFKGAHRTSSVFPEPSEYAYFLAFMIPFAFNLYFKKTFLLVTKRRLLFIYLLVLSIFLCRSMSLFMVLPLILLYSIRPYVKLKNTHILIMLILFFIVTAGVILVERERILNLMAGEDGSALTRYEGFLTTIKLFRESPIIGAGFGAVRGLDLLSFLVATTGVLGTFIFLKMMFSLRVYSELNHLFLRGLICMLIVTLISNPIIDLTFFWPILAFITVPLKIAK